MSDLTKQMYAKVQALLADVDNMAHEYAVFKTIPAINELRAIAAEWQEHLDNPARPILIDLAKETYGDEGTYQVQIDDDAELSEADEGTWVQAWVWLESKDSDDEDRDDA